MATPSTSTERVVVVVGRMGVGKSFFIKKFCLAGCQPPVMSDSPTHETKEEKLYDSCENGIKLADTVGVDLRRLGNSVLPMSLLSGKLVHFVVLLSSLRWGDELVQVSGCLKWAKLDRNITKWAAHKPAFEASTDAAHSAFDELHPPPSIDKLDSLAGLRFAVAVPAKPQHSQQGVASSASAARQVQRQPTPHNAGLVKLYKDMGWGALPSKKGEMLPQDWRAINNKEMVEANREMGERLLELHFLAMRPNKAENLAMNSTLRNVVRNVPGLESHISSLYPDNERTGLNDETLGDYVEALCYVLRSTKYNRKTFLAFLDAICAEVICDEV